MTEVPPILAPRMIPTDVTLKLASDVERQQLAGREYLTHRKTGRTLQLGGAATAILDELDKGVQLPELITALNRRFQSPDVADRTSRFLVRLADTGMLDGLNERRDELKRRNYELRSAQSLFERLARPFETLATSVRHGMILFIVLASASFVFAVVATAKLGTMQTLLSWQTAIIFLLIPIALLLHEAAHGVTARLARVSITGAGVARRSLLWAPYVRTGSDFLSASRSTKISICLAGPFIDWMVLGMIAATLTLAPLDVEWRGAWTALFLVKALSFTGNLSPTKKSDGSDALCAWFGDYRLRRSLRRRGAQAELPALANYKRVATLFVLVALAFWLAISASLLVQSGFLHA